MPDASDGAAVAGLGSVTSARSAAAAEPPKAWRTTPPTAATAPTATAVCRKRAAVERGGQVVALDVGREQVADQQPGLAVLDGLPGLRAAGRVELLAGAGRRDPWVAGSVVGWRGPTVRRVRRARSSRSERHGADHEQGQGGQQPQDDDRRSRCGR